MHNVFRTFIENLSRSVDTQDLHHALLQVSVAFDLRCFAYLSLPDRLDAEPCLISTYPRAGPSHGLRGQAPHRDKLAHFCAAPWPLFPRPLTPCLRRCGGDL